MKLNNENEHLTQQLFKVSDLALATTLSLYSPIETTEFVDNRKVLFIFIKTPDLEKLIDMYWRGDMRIEPQQFFNNLKVIKTRIYSRI